MGPILCISMTKNWRKVGRKNLFAPTQKTTQSMETLTLRLVNSSQLVLRCAIRILPNVTMRRKSRIGSWISTLSSCITRPASALQSSSPHPDSLSLTSGSYQSALKPAKFTATKYKFRVLIYKTMKRPISKAGQNWSRKTCSACMNSLFGL